MAGWLIIFNTSQDRIKDVKKLLDNVITIISKDAAFSGKCLRANSFRRIFITFNIQILQHSNNTSTFAPLKNCSCNINAICNVFYIFKDSAFFTVPT
jgi:hypothetical protein